MTIPLQATTVGATTEADGTRCFQPLNKKSANYVIDLCCGMGGLSLAAEQLNMNVVAGVDTGSAASRTFQMNFPRAKAIIGSVRSEIVINQCRQVLNQHQNALAKTIIVSGPPCQGFSVAGPRDANDPRNQILNAVARCISKLQPTCALIENVSRVLDENHRMRLKRLGQILNGGGYDVSEIILNAEDFGVPQRRKRAFFLITRGKVAPNTLKAMFEARKLPLTNVADAIGDLPKPKPRPNKYVDESDDGDIPNHYAMQHSPKVVQKISLIPQGSGPMSYRKLHPHKVSNTLISGHRAPPAHYSQPRSITVREAMRLQGFPDDFRVYGPFGSQMGQATNAVPPPMARAALQVICELMGVSLK